MRFNLSDFCDNFLIKFVLDHPNYFDGIQEFNGDKIKLFLLCDKLSSSFNFANIYNRNNLLYGKSKYKSIMPRLSKQKYRYSKDKKIGVYFDTLLDEKDKINYHELELIGTYESIYISISEDLRIKTIGFKCEDFYKEISNPEISTNDSTINALCGNYIDIDDPQIFYDILDS